MDDFSADTTRIALDSLKEYVSDLSAIECGHLFDIAADVTLVVDSNGFIRDARDFRRSFPDGRCASEPQRASVEDGRRMYEAALADAMEGYQRFLER